MDPISVHCLCFLPARNFLKTNSTLDYQLMTATKSQLNYRGITSHGQPLPLLVTTHYIPLCRTKQKTSLQTDFIDNHLIAVMEIGLSSHYQAMAVIVSHHITI